jgi:hypothetical protein
MIIEDSYTDRYYLEDYTAYYARCFSDYPKTCSRVHFFSEDFDEQDFLGNLVNLNKEFIEKIQSSYLGYVVIKPLPNAFLGGIYLKPYPGICNSQSHKIIKREHSVTLAGISLKVRTVAFTEQDEVVSACATSALWSYLSAYDNYISMSLPSPSAITQSATGENIDGSRNFPSEGLTDTQILRSIKHFGYEPIQISIGKSKFPQHDSDLLSEYIYAYVNNDIPVLMAGIIYQRSDSGDYYKQSGNHLVCILGYHLGEIKTKQSEELVYINANSIDKYYVHDDRVGPYARFIEHTKFQALLNDVKTELSGLKLEIHEGKTTEYFYPVELYIGVYHKVRLTYQDIKTLCHSLYEYGTYIHERLNQLPDSEEKSRVLKIIDVFEKTTLSINLSTTNNIKRDVLDLKDLKFFSFNGIEGDTGKLEFVQRNQPKYIWHCKFEVKGKKFLDILIDATEIPSGNILVGYMAYSLGAVELWEVLSVDATENTQGKNTNQVSFYEDPNILRLIKLLKLTNKESLLNTLFGPVRLPQRNLKQGEFNSAQNITSRTDLKVIKSGNTYEVNELSLKEKIVYIWLISEDGDFIYGQDIVGPNNNSGHATLGTNKPARMGGEIFLLNKNELQINLHSGNYSKHINSKQDRKLYLENVIKNFFKEDEKIKIDSAVERGKS